MQPLQSFERFAQAAREARELTAFARSIRALNEAEDPLEPGTVEAVRSVAALEAVFLVLTLRGPDDEALDRFRKVVDLVLGRELEEERADDLVQALSDALDDEGLDARLRSVGETLNPARPLAELAFRLCVAASPDASVDPEEAGELLLDLAEELGLDEDRAEALRTEVELRVR